MSNRNAPGRDGFPAEFSKESWPLLGPTFSRTLRQIKQSYTRAHKLSKQDKPGKDPTLPVTIRYH